MRDVLFADGLGRLAGLAEEDGLRVDALDEGTHPLQELVRLCATVSGLST